MSEDENGLETEEQEEMAEDQEGSEEVEEGAEDEEPPKYICGIELRLRLDGGGLEFEPIRGREYARNPSLTDMNMIGNHFVDHTRAVMAAAQTEDSMLTLAAKEKKMVKGARSIPRIQRH